MSLLMGYFADVLCCALCSVASVMPDSLQPYGLQLRELIIRLVDKETRALEEEKGTDIFF